jgi:glycine oxidase
MIEKIKKICPALSNSNVINVWSGIRPRAKGRSPLIGPHPNKKNVFIANGGFKIGIGLAPKIAEITADFLLENINHIPKKFTPNYLLSIK